MILGLLLMAAAHTAGADGSGAAAAAAAEAAAAAQAAAERVATPPPLADCANQTTQTDMNICSFQDFSAADAALNRLWADVSAKAKTDDRYSATYGAPGKQHARLLAAQRAWLRFRDAECLYQNGPPEGGGTIWSLLQSSCLKSLTEARIAQLRAALEQEG